MNTANELLDQDFIDPTELQSTEYAVINIPKFYVATNYMTDNDESIENLRAIEYNRLMYFMNKYGNILTIEIDKCQHIIREIFNDLEASKPQAHDTENINNRTLIFKILEMLSDSHSESFKFEQNFVPINTNTHVTFDVIRKYTVDTSKNLLVDATDSPWFCPRLNKHVAFYSQLTEAEILEARTANNDTELNRVHYMMKMFENVLAFKTNFTLDYTIRYLTLSAFMLCLCSHSKNINGFSLNDLVPHYLCFMLDIIIRTRLTTAWQKDPKCASLLKDMAYNYEKNFLSSSVMIEDQIERAKLVVSDLKRYYAHKPDPPIQNMLNSINLNDYVALLSASVISIHGKTYHEFNAQTFEKLLISGTMKNIKDAYNKPDMRERIQQVTDLKL